VSLCFFLLEYVAIFFFFATFYAFAAPLPSFATRTKSCICCLIGAFEILPTPRLRSIAERTFLSPAQGEATKTPKTNPKGRGGGCLGGGGGGGGRGFGEMGRGGVGGGGVVGGGGFGVFGQNPIQPSNPHITQKPKRKKKNIPEGKIPKTNNTNKGFFFFFFVFFSPPPRPPPPSPPQPPHTPPPPPTPFFFGVCWLGFLV